MKMLPIVASIALALPLSAAASVAMEAQQTGRSEDVARSTGGGVHRPLFIVKYVLRRPAPATPRIVMDGKEPRIVPPGNDFPAGTLGAMERDPNKLICFSWGCQRRP